MLAILNVNDIKLKKKKNEGSGITGLVTIETTIKTSNYDGFHFQLFVEPKARYNKTSYLKVLKFNDFHNLLRINRFF